ncbi:HTH-type transcriptional regulator CdhR [Defluviimonas aquaemixtae]|uniref:HTH-type transcriptional regulator CdhR n=1 Tax=Albidovulum aquaemixtae TaxID=1542388 RepID=A0A2R8BMW7_9RHOB|nr:helix-turn-helix domain-containing protein [Defluviimonas aquaemixtae]SPH24653.1 HTH-type transcriptional regulator CdhR [Defluviimonas aquaemixtae]
MTSKNTPTSIRTVVVGAPVAVTAIAFSILDVLASAGRGWETLHGEQPGPPKFQGSLRTLDGQEYRDVNGRVVMPDGRLDSGATPDLIVVPALDLDPRSPLPDLLLPVAAWVAHCHSQGSIVASVCSGAMVLAASGLLDGQEATTHWAFADGLARRFPAVKVRRERILIPAGEGHRVITAGGTSAWTDLVLYLIGRFSGEVTARHVAKSWLLDPHSVGQLTYASLAAGRQHEDRLVADGQAWAADHYSHPTPVAAMAERSGLTERSFLRRFKRATGLTPVEYVQRLRIEEAKQLLETTKLPIDEIAAEIGYSEPSSFRSAFRKQVGQPATAYRRRWSMIAHTE